MRRKTRSSQPPLVCRAALGRALAQPTRGAWCCMGKWRFKLGACAPSANAKCCRWLERLVSGPRIAPRSSCSTGAYTLRVAISVAGVLGRATDALGPKHRVSPPAFWIWRLVRAWSKAPGDTGRACPLPSSRVCGVLRAALACRERGPWPAYGPRTSRRRRPWALDARVAVAKFAGGEVSQLEFFRRRSVCVLRATSSARGCNSEPGPPPGIKLRGHELDCSLGALTLTRTRTRTPNLTLTLTLNQTGRT